ncbi:MAG: class GN sortase [Magnetococcales bacterium]|nr:class GN sortase [Magnetococcales bacterium]
MGRVREQGRSLFPTLMIVVGVGVLLQGAWIPVKAMVAQLLLQRAWSQSASMNHPVKPWPWADTWPVARLSVPRIGVEQIVLHGDSGPMLAFGPGLSTAGSLPGEGGTVLIGGHRDTHFRFLKELKPGDAIQITRQTHAPMHYRVVSTRIVDARRTVIRQEMGEERLVLATCYPFGEAIPGGPLRYLVEASTLSSG